VDVVRHDFHDPLRLHAFYVDAQRKATDALSVRQLCEQAPLSEHMVERGEVA